MLPPAQAPADEASMYFDKNYLEVDKILYCTNLFPVIHPHTSKKICDQWRERCIDILQYIVNYSFENHQYGIPFLFLRTDDSQVMDFTTINNRLFTVAPTTIPNQNAQQSNLKHNSIIIQAPFGLTQVKYSKRI